MINEIVRNNLTRLIIIGKNDEVLNPEEYIVFWKERANIIVTNDNLASKILLPYKEQIENIPPFLHLTIQDCDDY